MASDDDDEIRKAHLGSRAEWHPDTVSRLIDGYGEKCANIKGYLKTKDWEEIVKYVNIHCEGSKLPKTMKQCREKIDSLKRRYKLEKRRAEIRGSSHVDWSFFEKLDDIMRNLRRSGNVSEGQSFEVTEALDFEVTEPDGFEGDNRLDFMTSKSADKGKACTEIPDVLLDGGFSGDGDRCNNRRVRIDLQDRGSAGKKGLGVSDRISKRSMSLLIFWAESSILMISGLSWGRPERLVLEGRGVVGNKRSAQAFRSLCVSPSYCHFPVPDQLFPVL